MRGMGDFALIKILNMLSKNQNIDRLILGVKSITKNRCSLLDEEVILLEKVIGELEKLKRKRKRNEAETHYLIIKVVKMLIQFFVFTDEISKIIDLIN